MMAAKKVTFVYRNIDRDSIDLMEAFVDVKNATEDVLETAFRERLAQLDIQDDVSMVGALRVTGGRMRWVAAADAE